MVQMFMRDLKKVSALWSVRFGEVCYKGFLRNSSRTKFCVRLIEVSTLEYVCFREVPLYFFCYPVPILHCFAYFFLLFLLSTSVISLLSAMGLLSRIFQK